MQKEKKTSFFKKIFGPKSSCCSLVIEEVDPNDGKPSDSKDTAVNCCCSPRNAHVKQKKDRGV